MDANRWMARAVLAAAVAGAGCGGERFSGGGDGGGGGGTYPTEVAVENGSAAPISVTLASADGADLEQFDDVAPGTATEMRELDWASLDGVTVTVDLGSAQGGTVALVAERENLVQLTDGAPPALEVSAPPVSGGAGGGAPGW